MITAVTLYSTSRAFMQSLKLLHKIVAEPLRYLGRPMGTKTPKDFNFDPTSTAQLKEVNQDKDRLIEAMLPNVAFDGWAPSARRLAAEAIDMPQIYAEELFPHSSAMIDHFSDWVDRRMLDEIRAEENFETLRIRDKIRRAVEIRIEILTPHKEAFRRAFGYLALPQHVAEGHKISWRACDQIWKAAGDRSEDYNYYTKRGLLSTVIASTMLCWLDDDSENFVETRAFLERRIDEVLKIGGAFGKLMSKFLKKD